MREEKPPLKLHYRLGFCQGTKNENEHWFTGAVARKRERERERERDRDGPHHMLIATSSMA